jgi:hypothetical protein
VGTLPVRGGLLAAAAVAALLAAAPAAGFHFVPTHIPRPYKLLRAETYAAGASEIGYARNRHADEPAIRVATLRSLRLSRWLTSGDRPIRIRGHRGTLAYLYDEGARFGRYVSWQERPGVWIEVVRSSPAGPRARELIDIAEDVAAVSDGYWRRLEVGTNQIVSVSQLPNGRPSKFVESGIAHDHRWVLRALIPRGYPLGSYDYRSPCPALTYRRARTYGSDCTDRASWELVKGQIFIFGLLHGRIPERVRVRDYYDPTDRGRIVRTHRVRPVRNFGFYVAPMPRNTCVVMVEDADGRGRSAEIELGTPAIGHPREARRCGITPPR